MSTNSRDGGSERRVKQLVTALAGPGAVGQASDGQILVTSLRRGVRLSGCSLPQAAALEAVSRGLAIWRDGHLLITDAGRAFLVREAAEEDHAFVAQHRPLSRQIVDGSPTLVDEAESPLGWLARRRGADGQPLIDATELQAGERLRADLTRAGMLPRVTSDWSSEITRGQGGRAALAYPEAVISARQRVRRALDSVGPEFAGVLVDVCGFLKGLATIESERRWPARSAKIVLGLALRQLARHYGLTPAGRIGRGALMHHWGDADFRPAIGTPVADPDYAG